MSERTAAEGDAAASDVATPDPVPDLLAATPATAYLWGRVAGDGELDRDGVTVRAGDGRAADALAAVAGTARPERSVEAHESAHDASVVRYEESYELQIVGGVARRASAALGLPLDGDPGGYRFDALSEHRPQLVRGLLEACGTVCFRESANAVGVSFVHDDEALLRTVKSLLDAADVHAPTDDLSATSSGGHWFGLADDADVPAFAEWVYAGSDDTGLYSASRRRKLRRSVERATDRGVGDLSS